MPAPSFARWALAAHDQGGYAAFHKALMENHSPINEETLSEMAKGAGLDVEAVKAKAATSEIQAAVKQNLEKSQEIGISGTPGFIIGDAIIRGYIEYGAMKEAVDKARADKKD